MLSEKFIIISSINQDPTSILYVSNTSPVCWTDDINGSKMFDSFEDAQQEIFNDISVYSDVVKKTSFTNVSVINTTTWDMTSIVLK